MPPSLEPEDDDEQYESSQDSDFAPDAPGADADADASDSEEDEATPTNDDGASGAAAQKRKRGTGGDAEAEDAGIENSGDEAVITKGQKKRKKRAAAAAAAEDDEEGGEGGLVKTRSMRAQEKQERRVKAVEGPVTIDVDALWARMVAGDAAPAPAAAPEPEPEKQEEDAPAKDVVTIKRTYNFAGKVHTEEKVVPRDSAEARLYLASRGEGAAEEEGDGGKPARVLRRAFRSAFEPVLGDAGRGRADLQLGVTSAIRAREAAAAKKLNTVEKSRMDWAGYVDKEGLKDELDMAGRSKGSYNVREGFLARSEARREEDAWKARMAGRA